MRVVVRWWWLLLPCVAALELVGQRLIDASVTPESDWKRAAGIVRRGYRQGDLVVVAPEWASPVARVYLGQAVQPLEAVARSDESRFSRLWVLATRGAEAREEEPGRLRRSWLIGRLRVRLLSLPPPARVTYDFVARLHEAKVSVVRGHSERRCRWSPMATGIGGGKFACDSRRSFQHVAVDILDDLAWRPHMAIWAHPVRGATLRIEYVDVPLGDAVTGYLGLRCRAARTLDRAPVNLTVQVGRQGPRRFIERDEDGWKPFRVDTEGPEGRRATVRFEVTAADTAMRHFYFAADSRWSR